MSTTVDQNGLVISIQWGDVEPKTDDVWQWCKGDDE